MANMVLIKLIRSDQKTFVLGTGAWRILSKGLQGIDFPNFSVYSDKNGVGDGALLSGKRIDDRDIQIKCRSVDPKSNQVIRETTLSFFSPKYSYKIYITYQGITKWIEGELEALSCPSENIYRPMELTVKFYCKDPLLKSVDDFGKDIASIKGGFGFPYIECVTEKVIPCSLLLIAAGFLGCEPYTAEAFGVSLGARGGVATDGPEHYQTNIQKVFTAGDMHRGQSLVVWNIVEGRGCAREVDEFLMGYTSLREQ